MRDHPPQHRRAPGADVGDRAARHPVRQGRHHRARGAPQEVREEGRDGRRQADGHRHRAQGHRRRAQDVPAVQRVDRRRATTRSSTRSTSTSASPSTPSAACSCRSSATSTRRTSSQLVGRARSARREGQGRQAHARRDAGRLVHDHQPRRHRRHVLHADRQRARGGDPRHVALGDRAGVDGRASSSRG